MNHMKITGPIDQHNVEVVTLLKDGKPAPDSIRYSVPRDKADEFISVYEKEAVKCISIAGASAAGVGIIGGAILTKLLKSLSKWAKIPLIGFASVVMMSGTFGAVLGNMTPRLKRREDEIFAKYNVQKLK